MRDRLKSAGIPRVECAPELTAQHLAAFVDAFVIESLRDRARTLLRRDGWTAKTSGWIEEHLEPRLCKWVDEQSRPRTWDERFCGEGVFLNDTEVGLSMTLEQASTASLATCSDAIFSIVPGSLAVFFNHEWGVCYCSVPLPTQAPNGGRGGIRG